MKKIVFLTIRGLGETVEEKHLMLEKNLRKQFSKGLNEQAVFQPILFHRVFEANQQKLWEKICVENKKKVRRKIARQFLLFYMSDAVTYETRSFEIESVYIKVHEFIYSKIKEVMNFAGEDAFMIIIGQSLGCQIMSNYIWDIQHSTPKNKLGLWKYRELPRTDFEQIKALRFIFTSGCPIPLFASGWDRVEAIDQPNPDFEWFNYYDKDDAIGWPLRHLSRSGENGVASGYNERVKEDVQINTGMWLTSHMKYWNNKSYYKQVAKKINTFYQSLDF